MMKNHTMEKKNLTCIREVNVINIYNGENRLIYICEKFTRFFKGGWNVCTPDKEFVLNYTVLNPYYALLRGIEWPRVVTLSDKTIFYFQEDDQRKGISFYSETSIAGPIQSDLKLVSQYYSRKPLIIKDSSDNIVATLTISSGFEIYYHTYEIEYNPGIEIKILIALFLSQEMGIEV